MGVFRQEIMNLPEPVISDYPFAVSQQAVKR
jgi:hypothetical protein